MARPVSKTIKIALILLLGISPSLSADVKLRIYMQDGSLRAGNLVSESDQSFVILTKSGREEITKNKIMYVNGKTLAQWQARPDKFFQTEILPSEIPNPAYVNDKAALPTVPALPKNEAPKVAPITGAINLPTAGVTPSQSKVPEPVVAEKKPAKQAPVEKESPKPVEPSVEAKKAEPKAPVEAAVAKPAEVKMVEPKESVEVTPAKPAVVESAPAVVKQPKSLVTKSRPVPTPVASLAAVPSPASMVRETPKAVLKPRNFSREKMADYHMQRALDYIDHRDEGHAIQELHKVVLLNRGNEEAHLLLGQMYQQEEAKAPAEKYLSMPILKRNAEAKKILKELEEQAKLVNKFKKAFKSNPRQSKPPLPGLLGLGVLLGLAAFALIRKFGKKPTQRIIDAQTLEPVVITEPEKSIPEEAVLNLIDEIQPSAPLLEPAKEIKEPLFQKPVLPTKPAPPMLKSTPLLQNDDVKPETPLIVAKPAEPLQLPKPEPQRVAEPPVPIVKPEPVVAQKNEQAAAEREAIMKAISMAKNAVQKNMPPVFQVELPDSSPISQPAEPTYDDRQEAIVVGQRGDQTLQQAHNYAYEGNWESARKEYRTVVALKPGNIDPYLGLGYVDFAEGRWDSALYYYQKALEINPNSADAYYGIGRVYLETKQLEKAINFLRTSLQLDPKFDDARDTLALLGKAA